MTVASTRTLSTAVEESVGREQRAGALLAAPFRVTRAASAAAAGPKATVVRGWSLDALSGVRALPHPGEGIGARGRPGTTPGLCLWGHGCPCRGLLISFALSFVFFPPRLSCGRQGGFPPGRVPRAASAAARIEPPAATMNERPRGRHRTWGELGGERPCGGACGARGRRPEPPQAPPHKERDFARAAAGRRIAGGAGTGEAGASPRSPVPARARCPIPKRPHDAAAAGTMPAKAARCGPSGRGGEGES